MAGEAIIKIHRRWNYAGALRALTLFVDGDKIGKIGNGKTESFAIPTGHHTIFVKGSFWTKTEKLDIDVNAGETKSFECGIHWMYWFVMLSLGACLGFTIFMSRTADAGINSFLPTLLSVLIVILGVVCTFKSGVVYYLKETDNHQLP